jgi:hypothetical protein
MRNANALTGGQVVLGIPRPLDSESGTVIRESGVIESNGIFLDLLNLRYQNCGRSPSVGEMCPRRSAQISSVPRKRFQENVQSRSLPTALGLRSPTWSKSALRNDRNRIRTIRRAAGLKRFGW